MVFGLDLEDDDHHVQLYIRLQVKDAFGGIDTKVSIHKRPIADVGPQELVKIWKLSDYVPSLYNWNIADCDIKPIYFFKQNISDFTACSYHIANIQNIISSDTFFP